MKILLSVLAVLAVIGILADVFSSNEDRNRATRFRLWVLPGVLAAMVPVAMDYWFGLGSWTMARPLATAANALVLLKFACLLFSVSWWAWFFVAKHDQIFGPNPEK